MMLAPHLAATLLHDIIDKRILVIGDLMLDRFISGTVARISPEAPVPILSDTSLSSMPGGAANVARNICQLGATCHLIGVTGDDATATELQQALTNIAGLTTTPYQIAGRPTTTKTRFVSAAQQIMRLDDEVKTPLDDYQSDALFAMIQPHIAQSDMVILSDYAKGCLTEKLISSVMSEAKRAGIHVIVDPKTNDFSRYRGAYLVTPNLAELRGATLLEDERDETIATAAKALAEAHNISYILTTLSARGMRLDGQDIAYHIPSLTKDVFDVSGAGDTVVASLACALSAGASLSDAMIFANQAASIVVSKPGTAAYCAGEMMATTSASYESVAEPAMSLDKIKSWQKDGLKIGFTNGCFDVLHAGHIHILREAAKHCDKLIVGLNTDSSVRTLKGESRPIQSQDIRAFVLSQFAFCDAVILFDDETPQKLIEQILPDVLLKGGDYEVADIVGYDLVTKKGGRVLTISLLEGHSTTTFLR